jgi:hypothetical protein
MPLRSPDICNCLQIILGDLLYAPLSNAKLSHYFQYAISSQLLYVANLLVYSIIKRVKTT